MLSRGIWHSPVRTPIWRQSDHVVDDVVTRRSDKSHKFIAWRIIEEKWRDTKRWRHDATSIVANRRTRVQVVGCRFSHGEVSIQFLGWIQLWKTKIQWGSKKWKHLNNSVIRSFIVNITLWLSSIVNITLCLYCAPVSLWDIIYDPFPGSHYCRLYHTYTTTPYHTPQPLCGPKPNPHGSLGTQVKYTSRLEGNNLVGNWTSLNRVSNNKHCKYNCVVLSSFGQTNQLTKDYSGGLKSKPLKPNAIW